MLVGPGAVMATNIVIHGLERVKFKFGSIKSKFPGFMKEATKEAVIYVHSKIPSYPPAPTGSKYRRTGTLGRTITTMQGGEPNALSRVDDPIGGKVRGIVGTRLEYAPWVIDRDRQTDAHKRNGWWNLQDVVEKLRTGIRSTYKKALQNFLNGEF